MTCTIGILSVKGILALLFYAALVGVSEVIADGIVSRRKSRGERR